MTAPVTMTADDVPFASNAREDECFERLGEGRYLLNAPGLSTDLEADQVRRERHELRCELIAHCGLEGVQTIRGRLFQASINLSNLRDREAVARRLQERTATAKIEMAKWRSLVDELSIRVAAAEREGDPSVVLRDVPAREPDHWRRALGFALPERLPAMLFGDGDTLKTMTADAIAVELARQGVNVGIVDAEMTADDHAERVARLAEGAVPGNLIYLSCSRPLIHERDRVAEMVHAHQLRYLLFDSVGFLCHEKPESADVAMAYFRAVRSLGVGSLHVAHITKGDGSDQKPFGSTFWFNSVRALWFTKRAEAGTDPATVEVGFYPRKFNLGARPGAHALRFDFRDTRTAVHSIEAASVESLAAGMPIKERIRNSLKSGARTIAELAEELDAKPDSVKRIVNRHMAGSPSAKVILFTKAGSDRIGLCETRRAE